MPDGDERTPVAPHLSQLLDWQKRTAQAVTNLAMGMDAAEKSRRRDHDALTGLILSCLPEAKEIASTIGKRERKNSDDTDRFKLPTGDSVELTKRTQRRIVKGVLLASLWILSHVIAYFFVPHPKSTPVIGEPRTSETKETP